jgi:glycosyltransferase involved in cell wall biosynthesis
VITTSGSGFEEIIEDNISGYLVQPGDSELLAQKMVSVLRDKENLSQVAANARVRAMDFDVSNIAPKLVDYYVRITNTWPNNRTLEQ